MSIQNPGPEKFKEVRERTYHFQCSEKTESQAWGGNGEKKKVQELLESVFFHTISPQDQGSGDSLRVSSGSLYGVSPDQIPSKCWGWSNLATTFTTTLVLPKFLQTFEEGPPTSKVCKKSVAQF